MLQTFRKIAAKAQSLVKKTSTRGVGTNSIGQETMQADKDLEDAIIGELKKGWCAVLSEEAGFRKFSTKAKDLFIIDPLDASENYKRGIPCYALGIARAPIGGTMRDVEEAFIFDLVTGDEFYSQKGKGVWRNGKKAVPSTIVNARDAIIATDFYNSEDMRDISDSTRAKAFSTPKDIRRMGPALLEMAYVAGGSLEGYFNVNNTLSVVHASGTAMMRHAGCIVTDHEGEELDFVLEKVDDYFTIVAGANKKIHEKMMDIARG
jgi:myo-inositol-1(or 4)-monophosphatase